MARRKRKVVRQDPRKVLCCYRCRQRFGRSGRKTPPETPRQGREKHLQRANVPRAWRPVRIVLKYRFAIPPTYELPNGAVLTIEGDRQVYVHEMCRGQPAHLTYIEAVGVIAF